MSKRKRTDHLKYQELQQAIHEFLESSIKKNYSHKQIIKRLGVKDKKTKNIVKSILISMGEKGQLTKNQTAGSLPVITGRVDYVSSKYAYIVSDEVEEDIFVKAENLLYALDDDLVRVKVQKSRKGKRLEGRVIEIVDRFRDEFVGRIELSKNYAFAIPDFRKMHYDIFVSPKQLKGAKADDKVIVKIIKWPSENKNPEGQVIRVLGPSGENEAEIHSIIAEFGLPYKFPDHVIAESEQISEAITPTEIKKRKDLRPLTTITIDPEDAKDFDDAISLRRLDNGNIEVGVHIADVTHYVKDNGPLEMEAEERATSVYLVDRTIPMLPERLSNNLCSLRPNEDKLTFSALFVLNDNAHIVEEWFGKTIIHSDRRFTYEEAQERIETLEGDFARELTLLNELALKLRVERFMRGSINFETTEVKFELDENKKPVGIKPKVRKDAHKLVEEFMLLANKRVAAFVYNQKKGKQKNTFVYRTHDHPDPEKLRAFSVFAKKFGHDLQVNDKAISRSLNNLIDDIEGKPEQNVLETLAIRSMAKAKYTTEASGHFGLAFMHYTHFTSPIRRYPDMMVHRLLDHYLHNGDSPSPEKWEKKCQHSSEMEKRAADAERASIKYKQVEFMERMLGEELDGIVSGVTEWGIFVEMTETKCEGMVRLADLEDDYYTFDEDNYCVIGNNTGKTITLGDPVRVKVAATDINRRLIDLLLVKQY